MHPVPSGAITFLFTDIEGSTRLWEEHPQAMREALRRHDDLLRACIEAHGGRVFKTMGDAFCAAFADPRGAVASVLASQQRLSALVPSPEGAVPLKVRMALHTGVVEERDGDYFGQTLSRVARLLAIGHGGQVLLSEATQALVRDSLPPGATLADLGEHRLRDLGRPERAFELRHAALPSGFPPLRSLDNPELKHNLPQQVTSFVGRERELGEVRELLERSRLVTLTGAGGCGKSRLALQVAADRLGTGDAAGGCWLVELAALTNPELVPSTVAGVLGLNEEPARPVRETLIDHLRHRRLLLILDNCEHLLAGCAELAASLLRNCPGVLLLATSREGLGISGEQAYRVPSLSLPDPSRPQTTESLNGYEAVRLFVDRAQSVESAFQATDRSAPVIASICHRLDGIPLAIELAAARVRSLSVEDIDAKLNQRFRLLTGGSRTALPRQQTLRSMVDWSYDLLSDAEKTLFRRLSVFSGGWSLAAVEAICSGGSLEAWEVLDLLTSLVDKSLVLAENTGSSVRYRLLETVRQYGRDRLLESGGGEETRNRHVEFFVDLAEKARGHLQGPEAHFWLERLEADHDNLRAALEWCAVEPDRGESGLKLSVAVTRFWLVRGHLSEGRSRLATALAHPGAWERTAERGEALNAAGVLAFKQGDGASAQSLLEEGLTLSRELGDRRGEARNLGNLGGVAYHQGDTAAARALYERALDLAREIGDRLVEASALGDLGRVAQREGDCAAARAYYERALALQRELGNRVGEALCLGSLGNVALAQGDLAAARLLLEQARALNGLLRNPSGESADLKDLGSVALGQGDAQAARSFLEESLAIDRELGHRAGEVGCLAGLGRAAYFEGDLPTARSFLEQALALCRDLDFRIEESGILNGLGLVARALGELETAREHCEAALALGREGGSRAEQAQSHRCLGMTLLDRGDPETARAHLRESLAAYRELGTRQGVVEALRGLAAAEDACGNAASAARLWGAAAREWEEAGAVAPPNEEADYERRLAAARSRMPDAAFEAAWQEGRSLTVEAALALALEPTAD